MLDHVLHDLNNNSSIKLYAFHRARLVLSDSAVLFIPDVERDTHDEWRALNEPPA